MKLALLLPPYLSNLYDMACMMQADSIIIDDMAVFSRKSRVHRGKIRTPDGTQWINIPILTEDKKKPLHQVRIDHSQPWIDQQCKALAFNYRNSIYFDFYEPEIMADIHSGADCEYLLEYTSHIFKRLMIYLQVNLPDLKYTSSLDAYDQNPDILAKNLGAKKVFHEQNSRNYQRQSAFAVDPDITLRPYRQHFDGFEPDCCLLDLLFEYGPESYQVWEQ